MMRWLKENNRTSGGKHGLDGGILVMTALMTFALVAIVALVIDLGRLQFIKRQLQNAADAAALAGVNQLREKSPPGVKLNNWQDVKKAVVLTLSQSPISELSAAARGLLEADGGYGFVFGKKNGSTGQLVGADTCHDLPNYKGDTGCADNLTVTVRRGVFCYDGSVRILCPLEGLAQRYCMANSVEVNLVLTDLAPSFASVLGLTKLIDMSSTAVAFMDPDSSALEPQCDQLDDLSGGNITIENVGNNCVINWTGACETGRDAFDNLVCVSADVADCQPFDGGFGCVDSECAAYQIGGDWYCRRDCPRSETAGACSDTNCPYSNPACGKG